MIPRDEGDGDPKFQGSTRSGSFRWPLSKGIPTDFVRIARRKLRALAAAMAVRDLTEPPGNRLEKLKGDRTGAMVNSRQRSMADMFRLDGRWSA